MKAGKIRYTLKSLWVTSRVFLLTLVACLSQVTVADDYPKPIFESPRPSSPEFMAKDPRSNMLREIYSESHALLIGEESYSNGWRKLSGVKDEVFRLAAALQKDQFHVVAYTDLKENDLFNVIEKFIKTYGYIKKSRILVLVSGHGHTLIDNLDDDDMAEYPRIRKVGYFVPIDAPDPKQDEDGFVKKALRLSQFKEWAYAIQSKHSLMIFDACTSGAIFEGLKGKLPEKKLADTKWTIFDDTKNKRTRMFLTAGTDLQYVPENSRFMQLLTEALLGQRQQEKADYNEDGFLTGRELANFLEGNVPLYTNTTPQDGFIPDPDLNQGDFIFRLLGDDSIITASEDTTDSVGYKPISIDELTSTKPLAISSKVERLVRADVRCNGTCTPQSALEQELSIEVPQKAQPEAVLRNISLICLTGKCDKSIVTSPATLSPDGKKATVRFKAWSNDTIWAFSGDVVVPLSSQSESAPIAKALPTEFTSVQEGSDVQEKALKQLDLLESDKKSTRTTARQNLAITIEDMAPSDVAEIVRSLPNSSYRKALGVAVALGSESSKWKSSEPEVSKSILSTIADRIPDKTLGKAIDKAIENSAYMEIAAECTTKATGLDGARNSCDSDVTRITAPQGYAFTKETLQGGEVSGNGSEHECRVDWEDYVIVMPGAQKKLPRAVTLQTHATSPEGYASGRGWAKCKYIIEISKYSN